MKFPELASIDDAFGTNPVPLFGGDLLFKAVEPDAEGKIKFAGIASDEEADVEGDRILRKSLDLSYAQARGYVNWDHSRDPSDQLGYLTKAVLVDKSNLEELRKSFPGNTISDGASVYVEGELYGHNDKNVEIGRIMKSTPDSINGLGLSLDGSVARDTRNGGIVKAFVRGVAITPQPAQPKTLLRLRKSLAIYGEMAAADGLPANLPSAIAVEVVELLTKSTKEVASLTSDQAVLFVLQQRPHWTYELAKRVVDYTIQRKKEHTNG